MTSDLDVAADTRVTGVKQSLRRHLSLSSHSLAAKYPGTKSLPLEVTLLDPPGTFLGVSASSPFPEGMEDSVIHVGECLL